MVDRLKCVICGSWFSVDVCVFLRFAHETNEKTRNLRKRLTFDFGVLSLSWASICLRNLCYPWLLRVSDHLWQRLVHLDLRAYFLDSRILLFGMRDDGFDIFS